MSLLQALKIVTSKRPTQLTPIQHRRNKLIKKLHEQSECAKARAEGRDCSFKRYRTLKNKETGERTQVEQQYSIKQWWYTNDEGKTIFEIRYGSRLVEIAKGKTGVEIDSPEKLVETIDLLKRAIEAGELDEGINALVGAFGRQIKKK
ncbi:DUF6641 family protein [Methyloradius palustris]|uniref:Uncharacterized protein n=1 Tax=Methyloradius palustris TaxID=2778876 RepID=A0A8D5JRR1_9PROT|nr:DUF6641 family protein [Methyloradius palustris]BCM25721.1 hypothetical protein ZMTM_19800 [Methyloradius palustris]